MAVQKYGVKYPVVLDNDYATWSAYQNQYWPRKYIIDKDGYIRFDHIGEGGYDETEKQIQELLLEIGENTTHSGTVNVTDTTPTTFNSPETYLGWQFAVPRGENIGGEGYKPDQNYTYSKPDASNLKDNIPYLENTWYNKEDSLVSFDGSVMYYKFTAKNANIVLEGNGTIQVYIDDALISSDVAGKDVMNGVISVDEPRLYEIYSGNYATHVLKLVFTKGIETHAFTFG